MKLYLRLALIVAVTASVFASCKKPNTATPEDSSNIKLTHVESGNLVTLKWTPVNDSRVTGYLIIRSDSTSSAKFIQVDKNTTTLTDTLPLAPRVLYGVQAMAPSVQGVTHESNPVTVIRKDIDFLTMYPYDALYDQGNQQIYVYSYDGNMQVYDVNGKKWARSASFGSNVGFCDLGVYNGKTELYVPRSDGWLFIYDAATLNKTDQINMGRQVTSVTYNNGILYACASQGNFSDYTILSYDRASKSKIAQINALDKTRLKLIPGTNAEFYGITDYSSIRSYKFDGNGNFVSQNYAYGSNSLNPGVCEVFPDGNHFITTAAGWIYGRNLSYESALPRGNSTFTSFWFDNSSNLIYAGCSQKQIQAFNISDYQLSKTINTVGIPFRVFYNSGAVISVSTSAAAYSGSGGSGVNYTFIEKF